MAKLLLVVAPLALTGSPAALVQPSAGVRLDTH
jgi:hypothetical protein